MGNGSAAATIAVGVFALYVAFGTYVASCAGWQEAWAIEGGLSMFAGFLEFGGETLVAKVVIGVAGFLFAFFAWGFLFGPFTCATRLL